MQRWEVDHKNAGRKNAASRRGRRRARVSVRPSVRPSLLHCVGRHSPARDRPHARRLGVSDRQSAARSYPLWSSLYLLFLPPMKRYGCVIEVLKRFISVAPLSKASSYPIRNAGRLGTGDARCVTERR